MRVKRFRGKTMQEAVENLRADFGGEAVVLHTAQKRAWLWGHIGPKRYEVLGAIDPTIGRNNNPPAQSQPTQVVPAPAQTDPAWSEAIQGLYGRLIRCDIPKDLSQGLIKDVLSRLPKQNWDNEPKLWNNLNALLAERIATVDPWEFSDGQRVVVLIGPTGVGKTTTIAKLAANFSLIGEKKVGLITVDTYRIAAVEQLRTYAEIIGIPVEVAYSPKELRDGIFKLQDRDLILVDTAGRSQNNHLQIGELKNYLEGINAEIHLVVSATTKPKDVDRIVSVFGQLSIDRVIVTKLDETTAYGVILQTIERARAPLAFVTTGQGVPEDIEVASKAKIAQLILGD